MRVVVLRLVVLRVVVLRVVVLGGFLSVLRFLGEDEEIVEDLLRERFVLEQLPGVVGYDELVGGLAIADRVAVVLVVFDDADHFELEFLPVVRLHDEDVAKFDFAFCSARLSDVRVDGSLLMQVASDVRVVLRERP